MMNKYCLNCAASNPQTSLNCQKCDTSFGNLKCDSTIAPLSKVTASKTNRIQELCASISFDDLESLILEDFDKDSE